MNFEVKTKEYGRKGLVKTQLNSRGFSIQLKIEDHGVNL